MMTCKDCKYFVEAPEKGFLDGGDEEVYARCFRYPPQLLKVWENDDKLSEFWIQPEIDITMRKCGEFSL